MFLMEHPVEFDGECGGDVMEGVVCWQYSVRGYFVANSSDDTCIVVVCSI